MIRWPTSVSRKRITYRTEHVGTTELRRVIVQNTHMLNVHPYAGGLPLYKAGTLIQSHSQISSLLTAILALGKARSRREPNRGCGVGGPTDLCDVMFYHKRLHESCRIGRCIVVMKLICSLGHCECDGHTVHKLSQRRVTADWLALWNSDCSWMHSKVSSDWLPSYFKATRPVLEIFEMAGYFPDSPRIWNM